MTVYLIVLIFIYLIAILNSKKITIVDAAFFMLLTIISGFRYGVGTDFFNYKDYFELISSGYSIDIEPGFLLIGIVLSNLGLNSQSLFVVFSILTMGFLYKGIKYYTESEYVYKPVLYIILIIFVFIPSFNVIRQLLAAAVILYASRYIIEKKFLKFSCWVIIAMCFHYSSVMFLPLYFLATRNFKRITLIIGLCLASIMTRLDIINLVFEFIINNFPYLDVGGYVGNYADSEYNKREIEYGPTFIINIIVLGLFIFFKDKLLKNRSNIVSFNFFYLYIMINILTASAPSLSRLTYYFTVYMAISISRFGIIFDEKSRKLIEYCLLVLYTLLYLYTVFNGYFNPENNDFIPYDFNINIFKK